jgi:hypothetical protein
LPTKEGNKDIVFRFIYRVYVVSSSRDFVPYAIGLFSYEDF